MVRGAKKDSATRRRPSENTGSSARKQSPAKKRARTKRAGKTSAASYAKKKTHKGKSYTGMRVGRVHKWDYPDGIWHEKKVEPSRWEIGFASSKRRKGRAPEGSGAEPGSGYHWLIIADQWVKKVDANTYATLMEGEKHLISFQKPEWSRWNSQFGNQRSARQRTIKVLREVLERLEAEEAAESIEEPWDHPAFLRLKVEETKRPVIAELVPEEILQALPK